MNMITNAVKIEIVDKSDEAPKYTDDVTMLRVDKCIIVGKGTVDGNPTVDIQLTDQNGKEFLVMATGGIIEMLSGAVTGKRLRDLN